MERKKRESIDVYVLEDNFKNGTIKKKVVVQNILEIIIFRK